MRKPIFPLIAFAGVTLFTACERASTTADPTGSTTPSEQERAWAERTFTATLQVPTPAHSISIQEVWQVRDQVWIWARVAHSEGMAAQVITESTDSVTLQAPPGNARYFVSGITWNWGELPEGYQRVTDEQPFQPETQGGTKLYPAKE
ncbi:MAG: hypothetical protein Q7P63_16925 [Verrucomicrobiota bacterium JB022]|nr:hypothetical protein [Verrucomicrobiota bacterium JB022]